MNKNPLISIISPSYNSAPYIKLTINSIIAQSYRNWELIVVDDYSNDDTVEILKELSGIDTRIKYFLNKRNQGAAVSRNRGLEESNGRFIAFLDSDDLWYPTKLEVQLSFMIKNDCPISFTSYELIDEKGKSLNKIIPVVRSINYTGYLKNTIIGMSTSMIDTKLVGKKFRFVNIRTRQDTYLWITLLKTGIKAYGIPEILTKYRVRSNSISANKISAAKRVWHLYYKLEKLGILKSSYYFTFYIYNALKKRI
ncbi:glycosyltransferase family 2 protein [Maribacter sp. MJ134]|nr:glycosyltransferase family 2 protein [Maribacter sp. MJ134]